MPKMPLAEKATAAKRAQATTSATKAAETPRPAITDKPPELAKHKPISSSMEQLDKAHRGDPGRVKAMKAREFGSLTKSKVAPKPTEYLKAHQGKIPVKLQQRIAAEAQQERHAPRMASQKREIEFKVKDPKKIIKQAQPRIAAEVQQERHPNVKPRAKSPDWELIKKSGRDLPGTKKPIEQMSTEAKQAKFQSHVKAKLARGEVAVKPAPKPVAPKPSRLAGLREKATQFLAKSKTAREAVKAAKAATAPTTKVGKILGGAKFIGKVATRGAGVLGVATTAASTVAAVRGGMEAHKAGKELEQKAASAERKHGLKIDIKKPSLLKAGWGSMLSTEGPQVEIGIKYPKPPKLSDKA